MRLTLRGLEHASAAQELARRACAAVGGAGAGRGGGQTLPTDGASGSGAHGGAEVGRPAAGVPARSGGHTGTGGSETRHVLKKS